VSLLCTGTLKGVNQERYETSWTINPLLLEGSGYSKYKGYEDEVQALEDQARALEKISRYLEGVEEGGPASRRTGERIA